jgi:hypothetical protein
LCGIPQILKLKRYQVAVNNMEKCITTTKAIEERVYSTRLQQYREMLVELSQVVIVLPVGVKEYP